MSTSRPDPAIRPSAAHAAEAELLARVRAGEPGLFDPLLRPHVPALLALARRLAGPQWAEDLLQEVLIRAYRGLPGFRGESSLRTWLFRITSLLASEPFRWRRL